MSDASDHNNIASLDIALDLLRRPTTVHDRLGILQHLVNFWHGPIRPEDGMSEADLTWVPLPLPLRWWYRWAGKRSEVMSGQNHLFVPRDQERKHGQITVKDGRLYFYSENQGVYQWSTLPRGDDPPVFGRYEERGRWRQERITLSEHLILMCLFEAVMCHADYGASAAWLDADKFEAVARNIPPLPIRPWRWIGMRFFAGRGAFMCAAENGVANGKKGYSVWIGAKTRQPLQFLRPHLDNAWTARSIALP
jgi:hypothetical protein